MDKLQKIAVLLFSSFFSLSACSEAPSAPASPLSLKTEVLTDNLSHPWSLEFLPDGQLLVTERQGTLKLFNPQSKQLLPVQGLPSVATGGQGGLFDVRLHPDYLNQPWVYLSYAKSCGENRRTVAISRARLQQQTLVNVEDIFIAKACGNEGQHFGGRLAFDDKQFLYLSIGDRGERKRVQFPRDHVGTVLRLNDDGSIPDDNPFVGKNAFDEAIFTYGHRNPQGMIFHPVRQEIWVHEHGPRGGDEINQLIATRNYGWPDVTYGREYYGPKIGVNEQDGTEPPLKQWTPSIAPSGFTYYQGDAFPQWKNSLLVGALAGQHVARVTFDGVKEISEERLLDGRARFREVREGPDGLIYLLTDSAKGELIRISPEK